MRRAPFLALLVASALAPAVMATATMAKGPAWLQPMLRGAGESSLANAAVTPALATPEGLSPFPMKNWRDCVAASSPPMASPSALAWSSVPMSMIGWPCRPE